MPKIKEMDSIKVYVYADDHNPPHFHVIYVEFEELIVIQTLDTYIGQLPKIQRKKIINRASKNQDFILKQWNKYNS